jgi:DNA-binding IclR family transcriptional regulator
MVVQTYSPWMNAAAAPIRHPKTKDVTGAVVIAGPDIRLTEERMLAISPLLLDAAQELSLATVASPGLYGPGSRTRLSMFDDTKSSSAK